MCPYLYPIELNYIAQQCRCQIATDASARVKHSWFSSKQWNCDVGEDSLDCKEIKPVNPKGYQSWIFIGRTDAEAEVPILWPPDAKNWLIRKDPDAGKDWGQEVKGTMGMNLSKLQEMVMDREACNATVHGVAKIEHNWVTELNLALII